MGKGTTKPDYTNRHGQKVIADTGLPGTDHNQTIHKMHCGACGKTHGANGSDCWQRRCPHCDPKSTGVDLLLVCPKTDD